MIRICLMLSSRYLWSGTLSVMAHTCVLAGLMLLGQKQTDSIAHRKHESTESLRREREAEETRQREEEKTLQSEELSDFVAEELEALVQDALTDDERERIRKDGERLLADLPNDGSLASLDRIAHLLFEQSITNLQAYLAGLSDPRELERINMLLAKLGRFDAIPETFQLGHSVFRYDEVTHPLDGPESPHPHEHGEGPEGGPGSPSPPGRFHSGAQPNAASSQSSGSANPDGEGTAPFDDRYNRYAGVNHDVYGLYRSFISRRMTNSPAVDALAGSLSGQPVARAPVSAGVPMPKKVFVEDSLQQQRASTDDEERQLARPRFETLAYGVAEFQREGLTIDGNLDDWGTRRHPLRMRWTFNGGPLQDGIEVWVRWSHAGFYYGYTVPGRVQVQPNLESSWEGDCFEIWIDTENLRKRTMHMSPLAQQFCLMPFGYGGTRSHTFVEVGRGFRGFGQYENRLETETRASLAKGLAAGRVDKTGYTVEGFISRSVLARPVFRAGSYVAMNISVNMSYERSISQQWSLPKNMQTFDKPDTWGDVLLLGTDATIRLTNVKNADHAAQPITPGQSIGIEVVDHDMNVNPGRRDRVMVRVKEKGSRATMYAILEEAGTDSGVFRGSVATQARFLPPKQNSLGIHGGRLLVAFYQDRHTRLGEKDRTVQSTLRMATPVFALSQTAAVPRKEPAL